MVVIDTPQATVLAENTTTETITTQPTDANAQGDKNHVSTSQGSPNGSQGIQEPPAADKSVQSTASHPKPSRRKRGLTVTQNSRPTLEGTEENGSDQDDEDDDEDDDDDDEEHESEDDRQPHSLPDGNQPGTHLPSDDDDDGDDLVHFQDQLHDLLQNPATGVDSDSDNDDANSMRYSPGLRSTASSRCSFVSSASNYDMLLARLGPQNTDTYTPATTDNSQSSLDGHTAPEEDTDWDFWSKVISDFGRVTKSQSKALSHHIQRGIPSSLRGMVWQLLTKAKDTKLEGTYMRLLKAESVYEKAIMRDLPRTFTDHDYFQSKEGHDALFNVVKAYSLYDADIGYSQGITFIAGPLLSHMPEEEAFCVLVRILNNYGLRGHFTATAELLAQRLYQVNGLLGDFLPHVQRHLEVQGIHADVYASHWFITLFAYNFPLDVVFRIYDFVLAEGVDALFQITLALMEKNQEIILSLEFEDLVHFLKNDMLRIYKDNTDQLIQDAYKIKISSKRLDRLAKDYQASAAKAHSEMDALEASRRQNKMLTEAVQRLEAHLRELNKEHALVANQLISCKMEIARVHDENDALRQQSYDLKKALEVLPAEVEARIKQEMSTLAAKNIALVKHNTALEESLADMENLVIDMKIKYAESENERESLQKRLQDLKRFIG